MQAKVPEGKRPKYAALARTPITPAVAVLLAALAATMASIPAPAPAATGGAAPSRGPQAGYVFPVLGPHDLGAGNSRFGAGRAGHTHQGHDVMAECGIPVLAARGGLIQHSGYEEAAGNYLVIDGRGTSLDMVYMHLAEPPLPQAGDTVRTGQQLGAVGDTGSATGCHLHFEIWTGPGWYEGGSPIDPLPYLLRWDDYGAIRPR